MSDCIFCKIVKGKIPCYKVWEDEIYLAFLSVAPHHEGHVLLIPKRHENYFYDLKDSEMIDLIKRSKPIAKRLKEVFKPKSGKIGVVFAGGGVPHVHMHLIPFDDEKAFDFKAARHNVTPSEFEETLRKIGTIN